MKTIGCRIKELRKTKGLTQGQLGELLELGQKSVSLIEQDITTISVKQVEILSRYFNVTTDYLILGTGNAPTPVERDILNEIREDAAVYNALIHRMTAKKTIKQLCVTV